MLGGGFAINFPPCQVCRVHVVTCFLLNRTDGRWRPSDMRMIVGTEILGRPPDSGFRAALRRPSRRFRSRDRGGRKMHSRNSFPSQVSRRAGARQSQGEGICHAATGRGSRGGRPNRTPTRGVSIHRGKQLSKARLLRLTVDYTPGELARTEQASEHRMGISRHTPDRQSDKNCSAIWIRLECGYQARSDSFGLQPG